MNINNFAIQKKISDSGHGSRRVFVVRDASGAAAIMKCYTTAGMPDEAPSSRRKRLYLEAVCMLSPACLLKPTALWSTDDGASMVMPLVRGLDGWDFIKSQPSGLLHGPTLAAAAAALLRAVRDCHRHNVVHRDIKPENLLFELGWEEACEFPGASKTSPRLILLDFGLAEILRDDVAKEIDSLGGDDAPSLAVLAKLGERLSEDHVPDSSRLFTSCGTPEYVSPDALKGGRVDVKAADMWAVGVTLFGLATGRLPWRRPAGCDPSSGVSELQRVLCRGFAAPGVADYLTLAGVPREAEELFKGLLTPKAEHRYTAIEALSSNWLAKYVSESDFDLY